MDNCPQTSYLQKKYEGKLKRRKSRDKFASLRRTKSFSNAGDQTVVQTQPHTKPIRNPRVKFNKTSKRMFPAIDLSSYDCSDTQEYKAGPFYEDCFYDDNEMKISLSVDHDIIFDPTVESENEAEVVKIFGVCV